MHDCEIYYCSWREKRNEKSLLQRLLYRCPLRNLRKNSRRAFKYPKWFSETLVVTQSSNENWLAFQAVSLPKILFCEFSNCTFQPSRSLRLFFITKLFIPWIFVLFLLELFEKCDSRLRYFSSFFLLLSLKGDDQKCFSTKKNQKNVFFWLDKHYGRRKNR